MSLTPSALRQRIEQRISTALGSGWHVSALAYDAFPGADLSDREALSFSVGLPETTLIDGRQPVGGQAPARSTVGVRWGQRLRTDAHVEDYDAALDREQLLVAAVRGTVGTGGPTPRLATVRREVVGDGTLFLGELLFEIAHGYPL